MSKSPKPKPRQKKKNKKQDHERVSFREFLKISKWIISLVYKIDKKATATFLIFRVLEDLTPIANVYISAQLLDKVIDVAQKAGTIEAIYPYLFVLLAFNIFKAFTDSIRNQAYWTIRPQLRANMEKNTYTKLASLGVQTLEDPEIANKINRIGNTMSNSLGFFRQSVQLVSLLVSFVVSLVVVSLEFPVVVPLVLFAALPAILYDKKHRTVLWSFDYKNTEEERRAWASAFLLRSPKMLQEVLVVNAHKFISEKFMKFSTWEIRERIKILRKWFVGNDLLGFLNTIAYFAGYVIVLSRLLVGKITVGGVYFNIRLIERLSGEFDRFSSTLNNQLEYAVRFKDAYDLFQREPAFSEGMVNLGVLENGPEIEIKNMTFAYPRTKTTVIKGLNLKVTSGEKVAIVGHNGAGKTTLAKLLSRIYLPTSGDILVNGNSIKELNSRSLHDNMSVLFQDYNKYDHLTVEENVLIGSANGKKDTKAIDEALKKADAWDFVNDLPKGKDQILSERYKGGIRLSSGQWQKLAIARFFYRDAPLVIFDEPTAAIDAVSEYNIFNKIYSFFEGKTVIIISHRFSTVRNADRIVVFEKGRIVEEGSHDELMKKDGKYAKSFKLQAEGYNTTTSIVD